MKEKLFDKALYLHKAGEILKAREHYRSILKQFPDHAPTLHYYGLTYYQSKDYNQAINYFNKSINFDSTQYKVYLNRGNTNVLLKKIDEAFADYNKALLLDPDFSLVYYNKGTLNLDLENYEQSKSCFELCLQHDNKNISALVNLGIVLSRLNYDTKAKEKFNFAIKLQPDFTEAYSNRGFLYKKIGDIKLSIKDFKKVLQLENDSKTCFNELLSLLIQTHDITSLNKSKIKSYPFGKIDLLASTYFTILSLISGDFKEVKICLKTSLNLLNEKENFNKLSASNKDFILGFLKFMSSLLSKKLIDNGTIKYPLIYHLGESHCLSFAHQKIKYKDKEYRIIPKICFGVKAFHLAQKQKNIYKSIIENHINKIPPKNILFFSIGEIDCRLNEGFLVAFKKKKIPLKKIIKNILSNFLYFLHNLVKGKGHEVYFLNVPAPKLKRNISVEEKTNLITVISEFNFFLNHYAKRYDYNIIDIYKITRNSSGSSNNLFHCDDKHVGPAIIKQIELLIE